MSELEYGINTANKFDLLFGDEDPSEVLTQAVDKKKKTAEKDSKILKEKAAKSGKAPVEDNKKDKERKVEGKGRDDAKSGVKKDGNRNVPQGNQRQGRSAGGRNDHFGKENSTDNRRPYKSDQQRSPAGGGAPGGPRRSAGGPRSEFGSRRPVDQEFGGNAGGDQEVPERTGFGGGRGFRGGSTYRGPPRHFGTRDAGSENQHSRGREYERHSGSNKTGVKSVSKKDGGGAHNWGNFKDDAELTEAPAAAEAPVTEEGAAVEGAQTETQNVEAQEEQNEKTLKEYLEEQESNRVRPKYTPRVANDGEQETKLFQKMKRVEREATSADGMIEVVEYVEVDVGGPSGKSGLGGPFQLVFAQSGRPMTDRPERHERGERGGRGGGRGRGGPRGAGGYSGGERRGAGGNKGGRQAPPAADELNFPPLG